MYTFTIIVGHIAQVYIIFWPHINIKIHKQFERSKFDRKPISKYFARIRGAAKNLSEKMA